MILCSDANALGRLHVLALGPVPLQRFRPHLRRGAPRVGPVRASSEPGPVKWICVLAGADARRA